MLNERLESLKKSGMVDEEENVPSDASKDQFVPVVHQMGANPRNV